MSAVFSQTAHVRPIAHIQERVAKEFGLTPLELRGNRRARNIARPRQLAMYLASRITRKSLPIIGEAFGRDHTTVMHAIDVVEREMMADPEWATNAKRLFEDLQIEIGEVNALDRTVDEVVDRLRWRLKIMARRDPTELMERLSAIVGVAPIEGGRS